MPTMFMNTQLRGQKKEKDNENNDGKGGLPTSPIFDEI